MIEAWYTTCTIRNFDTLPLTLCIAAPFLCVPVIRNSAKKVIYILIQMFALCIHGNNGLDVVCVNLQLRFALYTQQVILVYDDVILRTAVGGLRYRTKQKVHCMYRSLHACTTRCYNTGLQIGHGVSDWKMFLWEARFTGQWYLLAQTSLHEQKAVVLIKLSVFVHCV